MKNKTLSQATKLMKAINLNDNYSSYFEGKGDGEISFIIEENIVKFRDGKKN